MVLQGNLRGDPLLYKVLKELGIDFEYHEHPAAATVEEASKYWAGIDSTHCKNIFLRNHKGDKHYLVILEYRNNVNIHDLEKLLKQGKLSFASPQRMMKYLGLEPGSVSPFGLIHDSTKHVHLFLDDNLLKAERLSFHPNLNTASLIVKYTDFIRFLEWKGNSYEFIKLYS
jgi:Ala-tRNA(Pro) deacylase